MDWITNAALALAAGVGDHLLDLAGAAIVAVAAYAARYAKEHWEWTDVLISEERVQEEARRAVDYLNRRAQKHTDPGPFDGPEFVEEAVAFVVERTPKAMKRAGITEQAVREFVEDALD